MVNWSRNTVFLRSEKESESIIISEYGIETHENLLHTHKLRFLGAKEEKIAKRDLLNKPDKHV